MHDPTHKFEGTISPETERRAMLISLIGQPPFLAILPFVAISIDRSDDLVQGIISSAVAILASVVVPMVIIMYFSWRYGNSDKLDVERREDRYIPLLAGIAGYIIGAVLLYILDAPWMVTVLMICYAVVTAAILLVTLRWKISIHTCGVMGPTMALAIAFWPYGLLYMLLLPPIVWSRYVLKKHTPLQLAMGAILGVALTAVLFWLLL